MTQISDSSVLHSRKTSTAYELHDGDREKRNAQGRVACGWLLDALKHSHLDRRVKNRARQLLVKRQFTGALSSYYSVAGGNIYMFEAFRDDLREHLTGLGRKLEQLYDELDLGTELGQERINKATTFHPEFTDRSVPITQARVMPEVAGPKRGPVAR